MLTHEKLRAPTAAEKIARESGPDAAVSGSAMRSGVAALECLARVGAGRRGARVFAQAIGQKKVTYGFERGLEATSEVSRSGFGDVIIEKIEQS